jgi:hypothetical protein
MLRLCDVKTMINKEQSANQNHNSRARVMVVCASKKQLYIHILSTKACFPLQHELNLMLGLDQCTLSKFFFRFAPVT